MSLSKYPTATSWCVLALHFNFEEWGPLFNKSLQNLPPMHCLALANQSHDIKIAAAKLPPPFGYNERNAMHCDDICLHWFSLDPVSSAKSISTESEACVAEPFLGQSLHHFQQVTDTVKRTCFSCEQHCLCHHSCCKLLAVSPMFFYLEASFVTFSDFQRILLYLSGHYNRSPFRPRYKNMGG